MRATTSFLASEEVYSASGSSAFGLFFKVKKSPSVAPPLVDPAAIPSALAPRPQSHVFFLPR